MLCILLFVSVFRWVSGLATWLDFRSAVSGTGAIWLLESWVASEVIEACGSPLLIVPVLRVCDRSTFPLMGGLPPSECERKKVDWWESSLSFLHCCHARMSSDCYRWQWRYPSFNSSRSWWPFPLVFRDPIYWSEALVSPNIRQFSFRLQSSLNNLWQIFAVGGT